MSLLPHDAYRMLSRVLHCFVPAVFLDVGANVGATARRFIQEFPRARVFAFEPVPDVFESLCAGVADLPGVTPIPSAVGSTNGQTTLRVMQDRLFSSVLPPSERGRDYFGEQMREMGVVQVPLVTLDAWAASQGISYVDAIKIDVQGYELEVLRGAAGLLEQGVLAVNCEAQLVPEYRGAATFTDIDLFLRERGFQLHQVHELWYRGAEVQAGCLDALWLREEALQWLRQRPQDAFEVGWQNRARSALNALARDGAKRVAVFGNGHHTRVIAPVLDDAPVEIVAIIDDAAGTAPTRRPIPVVSVANALSLRPDAVLLSSANYEDQLWDRARPLREAGTGVIRLHPSRYIPPEPCPAAPAQAA